MKTNTFETFSSASLYDQEMARWGFFGAFVVALQPDCKEKHRKWIQCLFSCRSTQTLLHQFAPDLMDRGGRDQVGTHSIQHMIINLCQLVLYSSGMRTKWFIDVSPRKTNNNRTP